MQWTKKLEGEMHNFFKFTFSHAGNKYFYAFPLLCFCMWRYLMLNKMRLSDSFNLMWHLSFCLWYRFFTLFMTRLFTWLWSTKRGSRRNMVSFRNIQLGSRVLLDLLLILVFYVLMLLGIEPWTFIQKLGDAVFIPAGCPHQVRNLKVICSRCPVYFTH